MIPRWLASGLVVVALGAWGARAFAQMEAPLPAGVRAVWDLAKADRQRTATRERVCLNGLWRWQPARKDAGQPPAAGWGFFKVPGCWPGVTDYMQKDSQTLFAHPAWKDERLAAVTAAWYQREVAIPEDWAGRRVALQAEYLNSHAVVYLDGNQAGEIRFPGGEADLTSACRPGGRHVLSMLVTAMPLEGVMLSYSDTASAREVKGTVARRGLCGDVYLWGTPAQERIEDVKVDTSVRKWELVIGASLRGLKPAKAYVLRARIAEGGRRVLEWDSKPFRPADLKDGRHVLAQPWRPEKLWDLHTPGNLYDLRLSLLDPSAARLEAVTFT